MINRIKKNPFIRNSIILFAGTMSANVLNYLFHLVTGRMVSAEMYGEIESLISLVVIVSVPATALNLIATKYGAQMKSSDDARGTYAVFTYLNKKILVYGVPLLALAFVFTPFVKDFLQIQSSIPLFLVWTLMFFAFLGAVSNGVLGGWQKFGAVNRVGIWGSVTKLLCGALLIRLGFGVNGAVGGFLLSGIVGYGVSLLCLRFIFHTRQTESMQKKVEKEFDFESMRRYVAPTFTGVLAVTILGNVDMIFAKHALEPVASGEYSALSVVAKTIFFATGIISSVLFAMAADGDRDKRKHFHIFKQATLLTVLIGFGAVIFFAVFPAFSLGIFFGAKYVAVSSWLVWFAIAATLYSLTNLILQYLLSIHITGAMKWFLATALFEVLALYFFGKSLYGIIGLTIAVQCVAVFAGSFSVWRNFKQ